MAKGDFGGKRNSQGFDKNPQNINKNGRPKKLYNSLLEMHEIEGYSKAQVKEAYSIIAAMTEEQLTNDIINNKESDILLQVIARSFMKAKAKGAYREVKDIMELFVGKPDTKSDVDVKSDGKKVKQVFIFGGKEIEF